MPSFTKWARKQRLITLGFLSAVLAISVATINSMRVLAFASATYPNSNSKTRLQQHTLTANSQVTTKYVDTPHA